MSLTLVRVTAAHIQRGRPQECYQCPVALAIGALIVPEVRPNVDARDVVFYRGVSCVRRVPLPAPAIEAIRGYDRFGGTMKPFEFPLDIPAHLLVQKAGVPA